MRAVLQLNASMEPLVIIRMRDALTKVTKGKAVVIKDAGYEIYPGIFAPSVIKLIHYRNVPYRVQQASRKNILNRDGMRCMYCGHKFDPWDLTLDHIFPRSRGGKGVWENLISACKSCNHRKADRTPEEAGMTLIHRPLPATLSTSRWLLKQLGNELNTNWSEFLWNNNEGDLRYQFVN